MKLKKILAIASSIPLFLTSFPSVALPSNPTTKPPASQTDKPLQPSDIVIPSELGYVVDTYSPSSEHSSAALVIHIQEAHVNYEAQQHLAAILQQLVEQFGLKLILVEGGQGDVGLESLRKLGSPNQRKKVAEKYLKLGLISAEEYLDVVSDYPLVLWGIEETELYQRNVDAFLEVESLRQTIEPLLNLVRETIELLAPHLQDPALAELQAKAKDFENERLGVNDYSMYLSSLANKQGMTQDAYPNLRAFLEVRTLEQGVHPDAISKEQRALFQRLRLSGKSQALDQLLTEAKSASKDNPEPFYLGLEHLAADAGLSLETTSPELIHYLSYLKRRKDVNPTVLANELDQLAVALREYLASSTPQSRQLFELSDQLDLAEKLVGIKLNPQEYERLNAVDLASLSNAWSSTMTSLLASQGMPSRSFSVLTALDAALPRLRHFYEAAKQRDITMVEHAMGKLNETHERIAVLITGGFHSPAITRILKEQQLHVVVVAPKVTQATDEERYRTILLLKNDRTTNSEEIRRMVADEPSASVSPVQAPSSSPASTSVVGQQTTPASAGGGAAR